MGFPPCCPELPPRHTCVTNAGWPSLHAPGAGVLCYVVTGFEFVFRGVGAHGLQFVRLVSNAFVYLADPIPSCRVPREEKQSSGNCQHCRKDSDLWLAKNFKDTGCDVTNVENRIAQQRDC